MPAPDVPSQDNPDATRFVSAATEATRLRRRLALAYVAMACLLVVFVAGLVAVSRHTTTDPAHPACPATHTIPTAPSPSVPTLDAPR